MRLQHVSVLVLICGLLAVAQPATADMLATDFDANSGTTASNANTIGWRFGVSEDIEVTQLGCLNGVVTGGSARAGVAHNVGIYSETTQALLASAVVTNGAAGSTNQWSWTVLGTPVTLVASDTYRIATHPSGDNWFFNTANHAVGTEILIGTDLAPGAALEDIPGSRVAAYAPGDILQYPSDLLWDASVIYDGIFGANFQYTVVPEPSTLMLLACGLFGLLIRGTRNR